MECTETSDSEAVFERTMVGGDEEDDRRMNTERNQKEKNFGLKLLLEKEKDPFGIYRGNDRVRLH